jgi:hypothetical protein
MDARLKGTDLLADPRSTVNQLIVFHQDQEGKAPPRSPGGEA